MRSWRAPGASEDAGGHRGVIRELEAGSGGSGGFGAGPRVSGVRRLRHGQDE